MYILSNNRKGVKKGATLVTEKYEFAYAIVLYKEFKRIYPHKIRFWFFLIGIHKNVIRLNICGLILGIYKKYENKKRNTKNR